MVTGQCVPEMNYQISPSMVNVLKFLTPKFVKTVYANSIDPDQTAWSACLHSTKYFNP